MSVKGKFDGVNRAKCFHSNYKFRGKPGEKARGEVGSRSLGDEHDKSYANMCRQCGRGKLRGPGCNYKRGFPAALTLCSCEANLTSQTFYSPEAPVMF